MDDQFQLLALTLACSLLPLQIAWNKVLKEGPITVAVNEEAEILCTQMLSGRDVGSEAHIRTLHMFK